MPTSLVKTYRFSAAHLYRRPDWNEDENRRRFGLCSIEPGHGHNYRLTVWVSGPVDPQTGFVADLGELDALVRREVLDQLDHRHINVAVEEFRAGGRIPTCENLVQWIRDRLAGRLPTGVRLERLRLLEEDDLGAEWWPER